MARVVLLTDFGTADGYAAALAAVIASAAPGAVVEHATHDVAPGDVLGGAIALSRYAVLYPPGTVHLAVVDPGVGTARRCVAATLDGRHYVGPDNGVFTLVLRDARQVHMVDAGAAGSGTEAAPTFHGRDIFAPAAAALARGVPLTDLGPAITDPFLLDLPRPRQDRGKVAGQVLHVDRFGNLITNVPGAWLDARPSVRIHIQGRDVGPLRRTYGDVPPGQVLALVGSLGLLEVSVRDGDAAQVLGAARGSDVEVVPD